MGKKADKVPPVLAVSGSQDLLRVRFLRQFIADRAADGWEIDEVDAASGALRSAMGGDLFGDSQTLLVVQNPEKADLDLLVQHSQQQDPQTMLFLHIAGDVDGRTKFGKWIKGLGQWHKAFLMPKEWDAPKEAVAFVRQEMERHGKQMDPTLALALVTRVGTDLGLLSFEVWKMVCLTDARSEQTVKAAHVRGVMAAVTEASLGPILEALATRSPRKLAKALERVRHSSKYDATMRVARFLGATVTKWVQAVHLDNLPPRAAATELKMNPWYFENKVLPAARRWGKAGTARLMMDIAAAERAVLNGAISPWTILTARLLTSCRT